jgi:hypothetical protein
LQGEEVRNRRYDAKRDDSEKDIVKALEKAGWEVCRELEIDLLCLKWVSREQMMRIVKQSRDGWLAVVPLECKTPQKNGKAKSRKDQEKQDAFCATWNIDKPTTPMEALLAVGEQVELNS